MTHLLRLLLALLLLSLIGCPPGRGRGGGGGGDDDDATGDDDDATGDDDDSTPTGVVCNGDALLSNVPLSTDFSAWESRWNSNSDLLRIMFLGEPF